MNAFIARFGQLGTRRTARTLWCTGKRKRVGKVWFGVDPRQCPRHNRLYANVSMPWNESRAEFVNQEGAEVRKKKENKRRSIPSFRGSAGPNDGTQRFTRLESHEESQPERFESNEMQKDEVAAHVDLRFRPLNDAGMFYYIDSVRSLDYKKEFEPALQSKHPDLLARCIFAAEQAGDTDFLRSIKSSRFRKIMSVLNPTNFIRPLGKVHFYLSPARVTALNLTPMHRVAQQYGKMLYKMFLSRKGLVRRLRRPEYAILLDCAHELGNHKMGRVVWDALHQDGHKADLACYNSYMATLVWNGYHYAKMRFRQRVIPYHEQKRREGRLKQRRLDYYLSPDGIQDKVTEVFGSMEPKGIHPDEKSWCLVLIATAHEGDIETVKSFLRKAWGLDVDGTRSSTDSTKMQLREFASEDDPVRPTANLLFTLAHCFGCNNDVPTALRLIDMVARNYSIEIDEQVWCELLRWSFVMASTRYGVNRTDGSMVGETHPSSVMRLWEIMTGHPYHLKPTMAMYNYLIKNLAQRFRPEAMICKMEEAFYIYYRNRQRTIAARKRLQAAIAQVRQNPSVKTWNLEELRRTWEYRNLVRRQHIFWLARWIRLLLATMQQESWTNAHPEFTVRKLPSLLWKWRRWAPARVTYETSTGVVEFDIRSEENIKANREFRALTKAENSSLRGMLPYYVGETWFGPAALPADVDDADIGPDAVAHEKMSDPLYL